MIRQPGMVPLLATGATIVAALDLVTPTLMGEPTPMIGSPEARVATAVTALVAALIIVLPRWQWWRRVARMLAIASLVWAGVHLARSTVGLGTGLLAGIALLSLASLSTTIPATRGRWPSALATSSVLGLTLYALMDPNVHAGLPQPADRFADIPMVSAAVLAIAAIALVAQAWSDAPARSLRMPRWIGLALAITCMSLAFVAWHQLVSAERADLARQAKVGTRTIGLALQGDLRRLIDEIATVHEGVEPPKGPADPDLVARFADVSARYPGVIALEWISASGEVLWASTTPSIRHPGREGLGPPEVRRQAIERARESRQVAVADPVTIDGRLATLIAAVPPDDEGAFVAFVDVEHSLAALGKSFSEAFDAELYFRDLMLCEIDTLPNLVITGEAYSFTIGGLPLTLRVQPNRNLFDAQFARLPNLLLAATLLASVLIGCTVYFAQTSAHRANLSARARGQLEQLIESARQVAIVATDTSGTVTIFNHGAERLTGRRAEEVLRRTDATELFDAEELRGVRGAGAPSFATLAMLANEQRAHERDWTWPRSDGGRRQVNLAAHAWRDSAGELLGYMFIAVDVTEREAAMRALDSARRRSEHASELKSSFLANVSHEIRTPMASILGCADLLFDDIASPAERRDLAQTIRRNGSHLLAVLNDILDISKVEAGQMRIEMLEVRMDEVVSEVVDQMKPKAKEKGVTLDFTVGGDAANAIVRTDPLRVRQILVNLVSNAIKFTERGSVTLRLHAVVERDSVRVSIAVTDTGIGIPPERLKGIFESYAQGDASTARRFGGTGLGLAISQRLARLLDGTISVDSEPTKGSTFTFTFTPRMGSGTAVATAAHAPAPATRLDGRRVLIVDDSSDAQRLISTLLCRAGAHAEGVESGQRAIEAISRSSQRPFDIVLLDMQMPDLDGYSTARQLRSMGYRGRIIALTGNAMQDDRSRCLDAGCDDHAVKPISREALFALCAAPPPAV
jgi:PAS domain S-box-containing protein